jgi:DNA-binding FadR family transcriptional regulator
MPPLVGPEKTAERVQVVARQLLTLVRAQKADAPARLPSERQLAERYQCSRNTVREALASLAAQGVVEIRGRVGAYPATRDSTEKAPDLEQALDALALVVPPLARLAAGVCARTGVERLESVISNISHALLNRDAAASFHWSVGFFVELSRIVDNTYLSRMLADIGNAPQLARSGRIPRRDTMETFFSGLVELLQALRRGAGEEAETIARRCVAAFATVIRTTGTTNMTSEHGSAA